MIAPAEARGSGRGDGGICGAEAEAKARTKGLAADRNLVPRAGTGAKPRRTRKSGQHPLGALAMLAFLASMITMPTGDGDRRVPVAGHADQAAGQRNQPRAHGLRADRRG